MKGRRRAVVLLAVQVALVLSVAGTYLYERRTRPRVWVRATQIDPNAPLRGRYLALQLLVDACALPRDGGHFVPGYVVYGGGMSSGSWRWYVALDAVKGRLVPRLAEDVSLRDRTYEVRMKDDQPCERVQVMANEELFIPDRARGPFPLKAGEELWVEVTVPASGPPRPIQMALSSAEGFRPLRYE